MSFRWILTASTTLALAACAVSENPSSGSSGSASRMSASQQAAADEKAYCADLRADLPKTDPIFELKGRVTAYKMGRFTHEITQFGRNGVYHEYYVSPALTSKPFCGGFPLYQISLAEYQPKTQSYLVTLKNGKTFDTRTNIPFSYRRPDQRNVSVVLVGGLDEEKESWFWYMSTDPRFKEPREISLEPTAIQVLEVF